MFANAYYDFGAGGRLTPFVGLGAGAARVRNERRERDTAFAFQGRAGVEFAATNQFAIGAEYVYLRTQDLVFDPDFTAAAPTILPRTTGDHLGASSVMGYVRLRL